MEFYKKEKSEMQGARSRYEAGNLNHSFFCFFAGQMGFIIPSTSDPENTSGCVERPGDEYTDYD